MGFGSGMAGAGVLEYPWGEVAFESVDGGLEYTDFGVDATDVEISPSALVDEVSSFGCEQRVDVLVYNRCVWADVGASSVTSSVSGPSAILVQPISRSNGLPV